MNDKKHQEVPTDWGGIKKTVVWVMQNNIRSLD